LSTLLADGDFGDAKADDENRGIPMPLETEEVQQEPKHPTVRTSRSDQLMKHLIAFAVTFLCAMTIFESELGVSKDLSMLIFLALLTLAVAFRKRIIVPGKYQAINYNISLTIILIYIAALIFAVFMRRYYNSQGPNVPLLANIFVGVLLLPAFYFLVLNAFKDRN
jgi:hypothetical protein